MKSDRIVRRQNLKQKYAELENRLRTYTPLVRAENTLRAAFEQGFKKGLDFAAEQVAKAEADKLNALRDGAATEAPAVAENNPTIDAKVAEITAGADMESLTDKVQL